MNPDSNRSSHQDDVHGLAQIRILRVLTDEPDAWAGHLANWTAWLIAGGLPVATTVALRAYQLRRVAAVFASRSPWDITPDELARWLAGHEWGNETLRSYRSALRSFYGWAQAAGHCTSNPAALLRKVKPSAARPRPAGEMVIADALAGAEPRVVLMLLLGSRHGLRRGEIARVHTTDLIREDDGWSLMVHGKGGKDRIVPLLDAVAALIRAAPAGWLFSSERSGGPLTTAHVGKLMSRALGPDAVPHQLRHRFASTAYQQTLDIRSVQELLGHASVATTQRYTAVGAGALRRVLGSAA